MDLIVRSLYSVSAPAIGPLDSWLGALASNPKYVTENRYHCQCAVVMEQLALPSAEFCSMYLNCPVIMRQVAGDWPS